MGIPFHPDNDDLVSEPCPVFLMGQISMVGTVPYFSSFFSFISWWCFVRWMPFRRYWLSYLSVILSLVPLPWLPSLCFIEIGMSPLFSSCFFSYDFKVGRFFLTLVHLLPDGCISAVPGWSFLLSVSGMRPWSDYLSVNDVVFAFLVLFLSCQHSFYFAKLAQAVMARARFHHCLDIFSNFLGCSCSGFQKDLAQGWNNIGHPLTVSHLLLACCF